MVKVGVEGGSFVILEARIDTTKYHQQLTPNKGLSWRCLLSDPKKKTKKEMRFDKAIDKKNQRVPKCTNDLTCQQRGEKSFLEQQNIHFHHDLVDI